MESCRIKKSPMFDLFSNSSDSSVPIPKNALKDKTQADQNKELVEDTITSPRKSRNQAEDQMEGFDSIESILDATWKSKCGQASSFISARVEEACLPGHPGFISKSSDTKQRHICVIWSCFVAVEVVAAWQRGETGRSGGFYSEEELKKYKVG